MIKQFLKGDQKKKEPIGLEVIFGIIKNRFGRKIEKGSIATTLFAYNHKTMNGNQPSTERFQPKPSVSKTTNIPKGLEREKKLLDISY